MFLKCVGPSDISVFETAKIETPFDDGGLRVLFRRVREAEVELVVRMVVLEHWNVFITVRSFAQVYVVGLQEVLRTCTVNGRNKRACNLLPSEVRKA